MLLLTETRINIGGETELDLDDLGEHSCDSNLSDASDAGYRKILYSTQKILIPCLGNTLSWSDF